MLDVSDDVRAEIGEAEAERLLAGENAPGSYDCTSCRTPGDTTAEPTSTVLFVGEETAVLAFAHARCIPSQVVPLSEEQLQGAVRAISGEARQPEPAAPAVPAAPSGSAAPRPEQRQAVLGVTCGQVFIDDTLYPAIVVEPTGPIARPGTDGPGDDFLPLLIEQGFLPVTEVAQPPAQVPGWSVLLAMGQLHAILMPPASPGAQPVAWWQAHQALAVTDGWRTAAAKGHKVLVYAAPAGSIGQQPREDLLREALEKAAAGGVLVAAAMPLAGT
ncbi:hypothetical protein [Streptomyces boncukensis]|uniref:Uncharacterized protein n=1 Tax=Streptomyces boncukensis TaxID=2711219 RepID=A0A6G4X154_9ACTN|nr:hypothetical protein [Streptomyces boncukensis]NGO71225.1 hypothetical protein [Streptomyces boncukensis]